jgi:digeranylgeranylglycerophospholipid reductase
MKIAIVGAGISGLACALECEKLGVIPDIYERDHCVGWPWLSVNYWPSIILRNLGDPIEYIKKTFDIEVKALNECKTIIMKSLGQEVKVQGKMGYFIVRGKGNESNENNLLRSLKKGTAIHYNSHMDYKELLPLYDYVVIATGKHDEARELNIWEDEGAMNIFGGIAIGSFQDETAFLYLNTEYAGSGYARVTPFSPTHAIVGLYNDTHDGYNIDKLFDKFLKYEKLDKLEFLYKFTPPPFTAGRIKKFKVGNLLFVGCSAGLTERFLGVGGPEAIMSGVLAARAMILRQDYEKMVEPLQEHVENISAFRKIIRTFENKDFDRLLYILGTPGIKQAIYNIPINLADFLGNIINLVKK